MREEVSEGVTRSREGEVERRDAEHVDAQRTAPCACGAWWNPPRDFLQREVDAALGIVHGVRRQREARYAGRTLDRARDGLEVGRDEVGDLRGDEAEEAGAFRPHGLDEVLQEAVIASEDGVVFVHRGDEDEAVRIIPARLVMRGVGGVASGRVMDDDHAAKLEERGADTERVRRVGRQQAAGLGTRFLRAFFHERHDGPPHPLRRMICSVSCGSRAARLMAAASQVMASRP